MQKYSAIIIALVGVAMLSGMDAACKALGAVFPLSQVVALRYAVSAAWLALFVLLTRQAWPDQRNLLRHGTRAVLIVLTTYLFFYAITNLPLAVASALSMTTPLFVALLGVIFLKEPVSRNLRLALIAGFLGALIIIFNPEPTASQAGNANIFAWVAALLAPLAYAISIVLLKKLAADETPLAVTLAQSALGALAAAPFALPNFTLPDNGQLALVVFTGFLGAFGYLLIVIALRTLPTAFFSLLDYTALFWAAGLGFFLFAEKPTKGLWMGAALIIGACILGARVPAATAPVDGAASPFRLLRIFRLSRRG